MQGKKPRLRWQKHGQEMLLTLVLIPGRDTVHGPCLIKLRSGNMEQIRTVLSLN